MRKLVTIQKVAATYPIKDADFIECCQILGWQCITKKDEVKVNDLVVYFEIDSFLPIKPYFEFLKKTTKFEGKEGYRLKTMKLKGVLSQGLVLPISHFPKELQAHLIGKYEGEDVTDLLEVIKYDNEIQMFDQRPGLKAGKPRGSFPSFIPKTDQPRIQGLTHLWQTLDPNTTFEETFKLDGCFLNNQLIETWDGATVTIGDIVNKGIRPTLIGVDLATNNVVPATIANVFNNGTKKEWIDITFEPYLKNKIIGKSGRIRTTPNHMFFTQDLVEKPAMELNNSDTILMQTEEMDEAGIHYIRSALLGDGHIAGNGHYSFTECHITKANSYNEYIKSIFPSDKVSTRVQTSGYGSEVCHTKIFKTNATKQLRQEWYPNNIKKLPNDLNWIDSFTIAKWYMDDGSLAHNETQEDRALFATNAFTEEDTNRLALKLKEMYNVDVTVYNSKGWCIRVNYSKGSINTFWEAISPYIHDYFLYKLPLKFRDRNFVEYPKVLYSKILVPVNVINTKKVEYSKKNFPNGAVGYDIETSTHNYFCGGILVHNSSMTCYKVELMPTLWTRIKSLFTTVSNYHFGVCSRNLELARDANNVITFDNQGKSSEYNQSDFWRIAIKLDIESKLPVGYAVQGELIGPKIQANHEKVQGLEYYIFDVFDLTTGLYLTPEARRAFCTEHGLPHVPVVSIDFQPFHLSLQDLLLHVEGESMNPGTISEGRVYKSNSSQLSFKAISNKYLLKAEQ